VRNNARIREILESGREVQIFALPDPGLLRYGVFHLNQANTRQRERIARARKRSLVLFHDLVVGLWNLIGLGPRLFLPFRLGFRFDRLEPSEEFVTNADSYVHLSIRTSVLVAVVSFSHPAPLLHAQTRMT
jgi:hypothetical protein